VWNPLSVVLIVGALLAAAWTGGLAATDRRLGNRGLIGLCVVEVLVVVQLVVALAELASGRHPSSVPTFLAYAVTEVLVLPVGVFWSAAEKSRSSTLVITVAALALAVMTVRMLQMWSTVHG
jgi:hypothetical protein